MKRFSALLSLAILLSACDGGDSNPSFRNPMTPSPTEIVGYALSGSISELTAAGAVPVTEALVEERPSGQMAITDATGRYSISGLSAAAHSLRVTKDGYTTQIKDVTLRGDMQLDIRLDRIASYILSGVIFEITGSGKAPIEDVEVYCDSCGSPVGHTFVYTGADGSYSLAWAVNGVHPLFVTKPGYEIWDPSGTLLDQFGRIKATVQGDTQFDVRLVRK